MSPAPLLLHQVQAAIKSALLEDLPFGDTTTDILFPSPLPAQAAAVAQESFILAGLQLAQGVFKEIDPSLKLKTSRKDGDSVPPDTVLFTVTGDVRSILKGERVALNFLQHLSGVATLTAKFCQAVNGYPTKILDTRKTIPGVRLLQKWAVRLGGGQNHRHSLSDGILIKDNHLAFLRSQGFELDKVCKLARQHRPHYLKVCVEADTIKQVRLAMKGGPDLVLLDNMTPKMVAQAVEIIRGRALIEVSGGITLENVRAMAAAGADFISIGALTHSAPAKNISLTLSAKA